jgi:polygalacturonase
MPANFAVFAARSRSRLPRSLAVLLLTSALAAVSMARAAEQEVVGWDSLPKILAKIVPPTFPDRDFPVTNFGANPDGRTDCKPAFDEAIAECNAAGGGRVVVPAGEWFVKGPIHLKSNVNLHLAEGATVRFSAEPNDYMLNVVTRFEGNEVMNFSPLVYAYEQENIAITGKGTLDGQAGKDAWWSWKGAWGA